MVTRFADQRWQLSGNFDAEYGAWLDAVVPATAQAQRQNVRLTQGYVSAFVVSETGKRTRLPSIDLDEFVGRSRDGRELRDAWQSPPIKAKVAVSEGKSVDEASDTARNAALALVALDVYAGSRGVLTNLISRVPVIGGWRRVTVGETCGACLGAADGRVMPPDAELKVHANCDCVKEPVIRGVPNLFRRPTGEEMWKRMSVEVRVASVGDEAFRAIEEGRINLSDLVGESPMATETNWLTQKPLSEVL